MNSVSISFAIHLMNIFPVVQVGGSHSRFDPGIWRGGQEKRGKSSLRLRGRENGVEAREFGYS
jgi:hypothetical protein